MGKPLTAQQVTQTSKKPTDTILVCWCDNGMVDGKFAEGLVYTLLTCEIPIVSAARVQGNQIGRQRQEALELWYDRTDMDWVLWVDSDIHLNNDALNKIWAAADPIDRPVVTGTYFISKENERSMMTPYPVVFNFTDSDYVVSYVHPLPKDALVKVDAAGFGFVLMHRNAIKKMREVHGNIPYFNEAGVGEQFVSEDIRFFHLMKDAGVPLYTHTGATVKHMKRFALDVEYYKFFWNNQSEQS